MKKKILVLGATGMLGNACFKYLSQNSHFDVHGTSTKFDERYLLLKVNKEVISQLEILFQNTQFDIVINCIGNIRPNENQDNNSTFFINSYFPKILDIFSKNYNFKFIHFSTDCVFDGKRGLYSSHEVPNEFSLYGMSKFLGEVSSQNSFTIRSSIIGIETSGISKNLISWFLSKEKGSIVDGYTQVFWNGMTTLSLAKIIEKTIEQDIKVSGIIHLGSETISKYDLLTILNNVFNHKLIIKKDEGIISNKTLVFSKEIEYFSDIIYPLERQIKELKDFYNI